MLSNWQVYTLITNKSYNKSSHLNIDNKTDKLVNGVSVLPEERQDGRHQQATQESDLEFGGDHRAGGGQESAPHGHRRLQRPLRQVQVSTTHFSLRFS